MHEVLRAREARAQAQRELIAAHGCCVVSFSLNIPGPVKRFALARAFYQSALGDIEAALAAMGAAVAEKREIGSVAGYECLLAVRGDALRVKRRMTQLEDGAQTGRLLDIDVIAPDGSKLSRAEAGGQARLCFLCGRPAFDCARSREHSLEALTGYVRRALFEWYANGEARRIGSTAVKALLYEVAVTPKPGLVDRRNSGAHSDMDYFTFLDSAVAIAPYFEDCAHKGLIWDGAEPQALFYSLKESGIACEGAMTSATNGANTHMGAIFSLGLLCAAAGVRSARGEAHAPQSVCSLAGELARAGFGANAECAGLSGARREAALGFPSALNTALPELERRIASGAGVNEAGAQALIALMANMEDANLLRRGGEAGLRHVQARASAIAGQADAGIADIEKLDRELIGLNLSPGGCADMLAAALLLWMLHK